MTFDAVRATPVPHGCASIPQRPRTSTPAWSRTDTASAFGPEDFIARRPVLLEIPKGDREEITFESSARPTSCSSTPGTRPIEEAIQSGAYAKQPGFSVAAAEYLNGRRTNSRPTRRLPNPSGQPSGRSACALMKSRMSRRLAVSPNPTFSHEGDPYPICM